jgi:hypothetical protein
VGSLGKHIAIGVLLEAHIVRIIVVVDAIFARRRTRASGWMRSSGMDMDASLRV